MGFKGGVRPMRPPPRAMSLFSSEVSHIHFDNWVLSLLVCDAEADRLKDTKRTSTYLLHRELRARVIAFYCRFMRNTCCMDPVISCSYYFVKHSIIFWPLYTAIFCILQAELSSLQMSLTMPYSRLGPRSCYVAEQRSCCRVWRHPVPTA